MTSPDVQPTGRPNARMRQTVGDMVRSMLVVLAIVAVIMVVNWRPEPEPVKVVDVTPAVTLAAVQATFPLTVPTGLPPSWRPTSARWEPTAKSIPEPVLHIGYVTPADEYAQVSETAASTAAYLDEQTDGGDPAGQSEIGGQNWDRLETATRRSLVLTGGAATTIVSGSASWDELEALAAALAPIDQAPVGPSES